MKRAICILLSVVTLFSYCFTALATEELTEIRGILSPELQEQLNLTEEEIAALAFEEDGELFQTVVWITDIDMEPAIRYGIDEAEQTREQPKENCDYPYEVFIENGIKDVIVDIPETEDDNYVQTYIEAKRAFAGQLYSAQNDAFQEEIEKDGIQVLYVSRYTPCVFARITKTQLKRLMEREEVCFIDNWAETDGEDLASDFTNADWTEIEKNITVAKAYKARDDYGVKGRGVKIGQFEDHCPDSVIYSGTSQQHNITLHQLWPYYGEHARNVHKIMYEIADKATYYAADYRSGTGNNTEEITVPASIEWLIDQGVNIINFSWGFKTNSNYNSRARWFEHIAYNHDVHVVAAVGNDGHLNSPIVAVPALSYNSIAVGNVENILNSSGTYPRHSKSSYYKYTISVQNGHTYKPDVMAPGIAADTESGTSYSAPIITGVIALMCEVQPSLKTKQHIVKAILAATTNKNTQYTTANSLFRKKGAGLIDAKSACRAASTGHYSSTTGAVSPSSPSKTYYMSVTSSDTEMRVALAYANRIKFSDPDNEPGIDDLTTQRIIGELKLEVFRPSGTGSPVASCTITGANLKVVNFDPRPYGTGQFRIVITQTAPPTNNSSSVTNFGVSWR